jgi:hypothetical protein
MDTFQIVVLVIAAAVLILILTSVGTMMSESNRDTKWPPTSALCPDGWELDQTNSKKCFTPAAPTNYGNVAMLPKLSGKEITTMYDNSTSYSKWLPGGDEWHLCGSATYVSADKTTITADSKSNFNYFREGDRIKIVGNFGTDKYVERTVAGKTIDNKLILDTALSVDPKASMDYYGKRISVDFSNAVFSNICNKKAWANANGVQWDGVSNYNKCTAEDLAQPQAA